MGDGILRFEIEANAFCHQMIRSVVGTLVDVRRPAPRRRAARHPGRAGPGRGVGSFPRRACACGRSPTPTASPASHPRVRAGRTGLVRSPWLPTAVRLAGLTAGACASLLAVAGAAAGPHHERATHDRGPADHRTHHRPDPDHGPATTTARPTTTATTQATTTTEADGGDESDVDWALVALVAAIALVAVR